MFFVFVCNVTSVVKNDIIFLTFFSTEPLERKFSFQLQYTMGSSKADSPQNGLVERF